MTVRSALLATALLLVRASLKLFGFQRTLAWSERGFRVFATPPNRRAGTEASWTAERLATELAQADARLSVAPDDCLSTSLLLLGLLRRRGIDATFHMGVRTLTGAFESHAWIELDGAVINDSDDVATIYVPMPLPTRT
ncbi:MAG: lasso peptide biosynthesis B2 protein [Pseudomonadota bacterium]